jgi:redox-sensing transcriptional repressor
MGPRAPATPQADRPAYPAAGCLAGDRHGPAPDEGLAGWEGTEGARARAIIGALAERSLGLTVRRPRRYTPRLCEREHKHNMAKELIPEEAAGRLFAYLRALLCLAEQGVPTVSSQQLAKACRRRPSLIRKDLSYFGEFGTRGIGYNVAELTDVIRGILHLDTPMRAALVGVGNIGRALLAYRGFSQEGFHITAAFDRDPRKIGRTIEGVLVEDVADMERRIAGEGIQLGIVAVEVSEAPNVARRMADAGVKAFLSFAPCELGVPETARVTCVDLAMELARLVYHL